MRVLDIKLYRDLIRLWPQVLAISLVMACGVAVFVMSISATRSLEGTRDAFYDRYRFASVFKSVNRAPVYLEKRIKQIPGVSSVELRVVQPIVIDVAGMVEPASGLVISIPDKGEPSVNRLYLRNGRLPEPGKTGEIAVLEAFAVAHALSPGDTLTALINGRKRQLTIVGVVLAPEYIYVVGPGELIPDPGRFGVLFMPRKVVSALYDMEGAFDDIALTTLRDANINSIVDALDTLLKPYGGGGAYARSDQVSHAFLDNELTQLRAMASVIPLIFLAIAAFLVNMILSRLIALEREQIGLLKAVGYYTLAVAWHYAKLAIVIAVIGFIIGTVTGIWLGRSLMKLYAEFFSFPFLIYSRNFDLYFIAGFVAAAAAVTGATKAIWETVTLAPAVAMRPPAPERYRSPTLSNIQSMAFFSRLSVLAVRHLIRRPIRTLLTVLGTALSVALLITSLFPFDSIDSMIDTIYFRTNRQDATVEFNKSLSPAAITDMSALGGVLNVEPYRASAAVIKNGHREKRVFIQGLPKNSQLQQVLDIDSETIRPLSGGLMVSERLADALRLKIGDQADVEILQQVNRVVSVPVSAIAQNFTGLRVYMDTEAMDRLLSGGPRISGVQISMDENQLDKIYHAVKFTPGIASVALTDFSRRKFREVIGKNILISTTVYIVLAVIITFGVIYNSARIQLSERARELASLRVFGFTRWEVSSVLVLELAIIVLAAQPVGWLLGYGFSALVTVGFETDLFRIPLIINLSTYAHSSMIVIIAAALSTIVVVRRVANLDLIRVLKTRE